MNKTAGGKEIPIFFAVDDGYCPFLAVAIQSMIDNSSAENTYLIKILNTDVSEENKKKIFERFLFMVAMWKRIWYNEIGICA